MCLGGVEFRVSALQIVPVKFKSILFFSQQVDQGNEYFLIPVLREKT